MKCIYCGTNLEEDEQFCPNCGRQVQLVPDYNIMDDEYLKELMEEEANRKNKDQSGETVVSNPASSAEPDEDDDLWDSSYDMVREMNPEPEPVKQKQKASKKNNSNTNTQNTKKKKKNSQRRKLVLVTLLVILCVAALIGVAVLYTIKKEQDNSFDYQVSQAEAAADAGDTESAISYYEHALKLDKNNIDVRVLLGYLYMDIKDWDSALLMFEEAINLDSSSIEAYTGLLTLYDTQGEYDKISAIRDEIDDITILNALSDYLVDAPTFSMESGSYDSAIEVALTAADDCTIYYTTDGTNPLTYGSRYSSAFSFSSDGTYYIYAVAVNENGVCSETVSSEFVIDIAAPTMPIVSPEGGNYVTETEITITVPDGCTAYYTWDGTEPNVTSTKYTEPITIPLGSNVLSVIIVDDTTEKISPVFQSNYTYYEQ